MSKQALSQNNIHKYENELSANLYDEGWNDFYMCVNEVGIEYILKNVS